MFRGLDQGGGHGPVAALHQRRPCAPSPGHLGPRPTPRREAHDRQASALRGNRTAPPAQNLLVTLMNGKPLLPGASATRGRRRRRCPRARAGCSGRIPRTWRRRRTRRSASRGPGSSTPLWRRPTDMEGLGSTLSCPSAPKGAFSSRRGEEPEGRFGGECCSSSALRCARHPERQEFGFVRSWLLRDGRVQA